MTVTAARLPRSTWSTGWVPFALVTLVLEPAIAGTLRLVEVSGGPLVSPANPRLSNSPVPFVVHIFAVAYAVLGAFQLCATLRRRRPGWYRHLPPHVHLVIISRAGPTRSGGRLGCGPVANWSRLEAAAATI